MERCIYALKENREDVLPGLKKGGKEVWDEVNI